MEAKQAASVTAVPFGTVGASGRVCPDGVNGALGATLADSVVTRKFKAKESELETALNFMVIDSPEKWPAAKSFVNDLTLPVGKTRLKMAVTSLSYLQWESVEMSFPMPSRGPGESLADFEARQEVVKNRRRVTVLEVSTGKTVPGSTLDEKAAWISRLGTGEMQAAYVNIVDNFSGIHEGDLIKGYRDMIEAGDMEDCTTVELNTMDDWMAASQVGSVYRTQRSFENYILEFPLKQINDEAKGRIDQACKEPLPPGKPGLDPKTKLPSQSHMEYDWEEPRYLEAVRAQNRLRLIMLFEAVLPFALPGNSNEEKFNWLGSRMMGDIHKLRTHIEQNLLNYQSRLNFFSTAYAPLS